MACGFSIEGAVTTVEKWVFQSLRHCCILIQASRIRSRWATVCASCWTAFTGAVRLRDGGFAWRKCVLARLVVLVMRLRRRVSTRSVAPCFGVDAQTPSQRRMQARCTHSIEV